MTAQSLWSSSNPPILSEYPSPLPHLPLLSHRRRRSTATPVRVRPPRRSRGPECGRERKKQSRTRAVFSCTRGARAITTAAAARPHDKRRMHTSGSYGRQRKKRLVKNLTSGLNASRPIFSSGRGKPSGNSVFINYSSSKTRDNNLVVQLLFRYWNRVDRDGRLTMTMRIKEKKRYTTARRCVRRVETPGRGDGSRLWRSCGGPDDRESGTAVLSTSHVTPTSLDKYGERRKKR